MKSKFLPAGEKALNRPKIAFLAVCAGLLILSAVGYYYYFQRSSQQNSGSEAGKNQNATGSLEMADVWLAKYFTAEELKNPQISGPEADPDKDGLNNYQEFLHGTKPKSPDSDSDGQDDGFEVANATNPLFSESSSTAAFIDPGKTVNELVDQLALQGMDNEAEIKKMLNADRPLVVPAIPDSQIKIVENSPQVEQDYLLQSSAAMKVFNDGTLSDLFGTIFNTTSEEQLKPFAEMVDKIIDDLRAILVPRSQAANHKSAIVFFEAFKPIIEAQRKLIKNPGDLTPWGDIIYQTRLLTFLGGGEEAGE